MNKRHCMTVNLVPGKNGDAVYHSLDQKTEEIWRHMHSICLEMRAGAGHSNRIALS